MVTPGTVNADVGVVDKRPKRLAVTMAAEIFMVTVFWFGGVVMVDDGDADGFL